MNDDSDRDIIDEIDELTEPGEDAATWTAAESDHAPDWDSPAPGAMSALFLDATSLRVLDIDRTNPRADIGRLVGDPNTKLTNEIRTVGFWTGHDSVRNAPVNRAAGQLLIALVRAAAEGDYTVSDSERDHIHTLQADPQAAPVIHGPCLITGIDHESNPTPLDEAFKYWFTALVKEVELAASAIDHVLAELGLPVDQITVIYFD